MSNQRKNSIRGNFNGEYLGKIENSVSMVFSKTNSDQSVFKNDKKKGTLSQRVVVCFILYKKKKKKKKNTNFARETCI